MTITTLADALFSAGLIIPVAISTQDYMTRPTWHKAATLTALLLVFLGYASSLFLSLHFEDHTAYMVAFGTSTLGACWLVIASLMNLWRLCLRLTTLAASQSQTRTQLRVFGVPSSGIIGVLGLGQASAVACFIIGCVYLAIVHAGAPISSLADAMARVESESWSDSAMWAGYVVQTAVLGLFAIALAGLLRFVPSKAAKIALESNGGKMEGLARTAYYNLVATVLSVLIRTSYHLVEFYMTDPEGLEVAATSTLGFYLDLAPIFCACWAVLGQSTALNTADELAEIRLSGWPGNEKQASAC